MSTVLTHKEYEAVPIEKALAVESKLATASSFLAGQYLSQWMIEALAGHEVAKKVMRSVAPL